MRAQAPTTEQVVPVLGGDDGFPVRPPARSLAARIKKLSTIFRFAWERGGSATDIMRLAYHAAVKPPLAARGLAAYSSERILRFKLRASNGHCLNVRARDCGDDIGTIVEFFSRLRQLVPSDLPALEPK